MIIGLVENIIEIPGAVDELQTLLAAASLEGDQSAFLEGEVIDVLITVQKPEQQPDREEWCGALLMVFCSGGQRLRLDGLSVTVRSKSRDDDSVTLQPGRITSRGDVFLERLPVGDRDFTLIVAITDGGGPVTQSVTSMAAAPEYAVADALDQLQQAQEFRSKDGRVLATVVPPDRTGQMRIAFGTDDPALAAGTIRFAFINQGDGRVLYEDSVALVDGSAVVVCRPPAGGPGVCDFRFEAHLPESDGQ